MAAKALSFFLDICIILIKSAKHNKKSINDMIYDIE